MTHQELILLLCLSTSSMATGCAGLPRPPSPENAREFMVRQGQPGRADVILVHGCPALPDGSPSTCNQRRVAAAVDGYQRGLAPRVLFTGGGVLNRHPESLVMASYARTLGLPESAILTETESRHTVTNLSVGKGIMKRLGMTTAIQVSEAMHLVWAKQLAQFYRMKTTLLPADMLPPYTDSYVRANRFDEVEPWKTQTGAYGRPSQEALSPSLASAVGADRRVACVAVVDDDATAEAVQRAVAEFAGVELQLLRTRAWRSVGSNRRLVSDAVHAWTQGWNGPVDEVVVLGVGRGALVATAAAETIHSPSTPIRVERVGALVTGKGHYASDWSRSAAPLRWVVLGTVAPYDQGTNVSVSAARSGGSDLAIHVRDALQSPALVASIDAGAGR